VRERLESSGREVQVAHARKVRDVAPLACKTDKADARVLAELRRRDLVPALWLPSPSDRALRDGTAGARAWQGIWAFRLEQAIEHRVRVSATKELCHESRIAGGDRRRAVRRGPARAW
jgi:hypothetical protein